jgi:hypothetical protein
MLIALEALDNRWMEDVTSLLTTSSFCSCVSVGNRSYKGFIDNYIQAHPNARSIFLHDLSRYAERLASSNGNTFIDGSWFSMVSALGYSAKSGEAELIKLLEEARSRAGIPDICVITVESNTKHWLEQTYREQPDLSGLSQDEYWLWSAGIFARWAGYDRVAWLHFSQEANSDSPKAIVKTIRQRMFLKQSEGCY